MFHIILTIEKKSTFLRLIKYNICTIFKDCTLFLHLFNAYMMVPTTVAVPIVAGKIVNTQPENKMLFIKPNIELINMLAKSNDLLLDFQKDENIMYKKS